MLHSSTLIRSLCVAVIFAVSPWGSGDSLRAQAPGSTGSQESASAPSQQGVFSDLAKGPMSGHYTMTATSTAVAESGPHAGYIPVEVSLRLVSPPRDRAVFEIPVWTPGSYYRREFPERIQDVRAAGPDGKALEVLRLHRSAWQVRTSTLPEVTLTYTVRLSPRDRSMLKDDRRRAITFEGPRVWMYLRGKDGTPARMPCHVNFALPEGWDVYGGLLRRDDGGHFAPSYDFLADCPTKLGVCQTYTFDLRGCRFEVVVDARKDLDIDTTDWLPGIEQICAATSDVFGGGFPMDRYVFLFTAQSGFGGGGLEHLNSTNIDTGATVLLRNPTRTFGIVAHEFFHTWNVKRVRPQELGPFRYDREVYTTGMWVAEGWTSYYDELLLVRAGLNAVEDFWPRMARTITRFENTHARQWLSAEEASRRYWLNKPGDRVLSYYTAGQVLALLLDVEIRANTQGARGLDSVFRILEAQRVAGDDRGYGFGGGYSAADVEAAVAAIAGDRLGGIAVSEWFDRYVRGTMTPDYKAVLAKAGLNCTIEWREGTRLRGIRELGDRLVFVDRRNLDGGDRTGALDPLRAAGTVVSVAGEKVTDLAGVQRLLEGVPVDTEIQVGFLMMDGRERRAVAFVERTQQARVKVEPMANASPEQLAVRTSLLQGDPLPR